MVVVVYTALFGNIDRLWSVPPVAQGVRHVAFTDKPRREVGLWSGKDIAAGTESTAARPTWEQVIVVPRWDARRTARHYKTMAHEHLDADVLVWVDGSARLLIDPVQAAEKWLKGDLAALKHPDRLCLYDEARFCAQKGKDDRGAIDAQVKRYRGERMPPGWGLAETRILMWRDNAKMRLLGRAWWNEIERGSVRDQIALPFVCWDAGLKWAEIPGRCGPTRARGPFWFRKHRT